MPIVHKQLLFGIMKQVRNARDYVKKNIKDKQEIVKGVGHHRNMETYYKEMLKNRVNENKERQQMDNNDGKNREIKNKEEVPNRRADRIFE